MDRDQREGLFDSLYSAHSEVPDAALPWLLAVARRALANQERSRRRRAALRTKMVRELLERSRPALWVWRGLGSLLAPVREPMGASPPTNL
jgi:hypothetical protein